MLTVVSTLFACLGMWDIDQCEIQIITMLKVILSLEHVANVLVRIEVGTQVRAAS